MSTFVVLGEAGASRKLINATLDDYLDTHLEHTPDEDFAFVIAAGYKNLSTKNSSMESVIEWCQEAEVYFELFHNSDDVAPFEGAAEVSFGYDDDTYMIAAVERGYAYDRDNTVVLALVGEVEPSVEVRRAIERAIDSHMVVRDLAEGALTYIKFHGDAVDTEPPPEDDMAAEEEETLSLAELVELADEGDEDAAAALTEACEEAEIDPDEYATWAELAPVLAEALGLEEEEEEAEEDEESDDDSGWTEEALKGMTLKEVREHAEAAGIEGAKKMPRAKLVEALIAGTSEEGGEEEEEAPAPKRGAKASSAKADPSDVDLAELAGAIVDAVIAALVAKRK